MSQAESDEINLTATIRRQSSIMLTSYDSYNGIIADLDNKADEHHSPRPSGQNENVSLSPDDLTTMSLEDGDRRSEINSCIDDEPCTIADSNDVNLSLKSLSEFDYKELYLETLSVILHKIGEDGCAKNDELFKCAQEAFNFGRELHEKLLKKAKSMKAPNLILEVEIIQAKDLNPKDSNGLADPFIELHLSSASNDRKKTSVKRKTLNPKYRESFTLPILNDPNSETLVVKVWDFDDVESMTEKLQNLRHVKTAKSIRKMVKEVVVKVSSGKQSEELIGSIKIPLKLIPASGFVDWFQLSKKGKRDSQGKLELQISFSSKKSYEVASQKYRKLLRIFLTRELQLSNVMPYEWSLGNFSAAAKAILTQHQAQSEITAIDEAFAQYSIFSEVHEQHKLSFELFDGILDIIIRPILNQNLDHVDVIPVFWVSTKRLLASCFKYVTNIHNKTPSSLTFANLSNAVHIISKVEMLTPPDSMDLFSGNSYYWLVRKKNVSCTIKEAMGQAVTFAAEKYFDDSLNKDQEKLTKDDYAAQIRDLDGIVMLIHSDLKEAKQHNKIFEETMGLQYVYLVYKAYDQKMAELMEPLITDICATKIERIDLLETENVDQNNYEKINDALTSLFQLFLSLQSLTKLGSDLSPGSVPKTSNFHEWFSNCIIYWIDISIFKALTRIRKAVELDCLVSVDSTVNYSSSAVDAVAIFYQIQIFWHQLDLPKTKTNFSFARRIIEEVCRCCLFYADAMANRVNDSGIIETASERKFEVTVEWCVAVSNIDYICESIDSFVKVLGIEDFDEKSSITLNNKIQRTVQKAEEGIAALIESFATNTQAELLRHLTEIAEPDQNDATAMDRFLAFIDSSLEILFNELNDKYFMRIIGIIWDILSSLMLELVNTNLEKGRPPSFYSFLRETLHVCVEIFQNSNGDLAVSSIDQEKLEKLDRLMELHGRATVDLIHQYYNERYELQNAMNESSYGCISVQCCFKQNVLEIEIMSARNLHPMDSNGLCDPYVTIHFYPEHPSIDNSQLKTKVHEKTLFPLFDEKFSITFTEEYRRLHDAFILFSVIDQDYYGISNEYIAEAFVKFQDVDNFTNSDNSLKLMNLMLSRPQNEESMESIIALNARPDDEEANDFLETSRHKYNLPTGQRRRRKRNIFQLFFFCF